MKGLDPTGTSTSHEAINRELAACSEAGGGTVSLPPGRYVCGTVFLRSGVTLHLEEGARIVGSPDLDAYAAFEPANHAEFHLGAWWHRALILGEEVVDAAITGPGVIDGASLRDPDGEEGMRGPHTILIGNSRRVTFRDFTVVDSGNYALLVEYTDEVEFRNLEIRGGWDGIHIRGQKGQPCRDLLIADCDLRTGDDAIAGRYWSRTRISGNRVNSSCNGIRLIGPSEDLEIRNNTFTGPGAYPHVTQNRFNALAGILIQPGSWDPTEGTVERTRILDNRMENLQCAIAAQIQPGNTCGDISVEGLRAKGIYGPASSFESWHEDPIRRVSLRDVDIRYTPEAVFAGTPDDVVAKPQLGVRHLPAWGLYARNVGKIELEEVRLSIDGDDSRPERVWERVEEVRGGE